MIKSSSIVTTSLSALVIACVMAAFYAQPSVAQTAKNLKCNGCVKSKQVKNNGIRSKDIKNGQVRNTDIGKGAVTVDKLADDVTALGLDGLLVVPGAAFATARGNLQFDFVPAGGYIRSSTLNGVALAQAPVHLPDGVVISELEAIVFDNSVIENVIVRLLKSDMRTGDFTIMSQVFTTTAEASNSIQTISTTDLTEPLVDLQNNMYWVDLRVDGDGVDVENTRVYGARIFY